MCDSDEVLTHCNCINDVLSAVKFLTVTLFPTTGVMAVCVCHSWTKAAISVLVLRLYSSLTDVTLERNFRQPIMGLSVSFLCFHHHRFTHAQQTRTVTYLHASSLTEQHSAKGLHSHTLHDKQTSVHMGS